MKKSRKNIEISALSLYFLILYVWLIVSCLFIWTLHYFIVTDNGQEFALTELVLLILPMEFNGMNNPIMNGWIFRMDELRKDFEEYQEDSKTLEIELDTQIKQTEQKNKDLTACVNRLQNDNENLRVSYSSLTRRCSLMSCYNHKF